MELEGKIISARAIVNRYQGKDETFKSLHNVFKEHNDNCRKLIGTDYADITVRRYDNCLKYLMELVRRDYKVDDMLLREVDVYKRQAITVSSFDPVRREVARLTLEKLISDGRIHPCLLYTSRCV